MSDEKLVEAIARAFTGLHIVGMEGDLVRPENVARAALAAIEREGWKVAPVEPEWRDNHDWKEHDGGMVCSRCGLGYTNIPCLSAVPKQG